VIVIGIDPGKDGAVVALHVEEMNVLYTALTCKMVLGKDYSGALMTMALIDAKNATPDWVAGDQPVFVVIEAQLARKGKVVPGLTSVLNTGRGWGLWEGITAALGLPFDAKVSPSAWTAKMGVTGDKATHVRRAMELLPSLDLMPGKRTTPHHGLADAGLLAVYGARYLIGGRG